MAEEEGPPSESLFVRSLPAGITQDLLIEIFAQYATVSMCKVLPATSKEGLTSALIRCGSVEDAKMLIDLLNGNIPAGLETPIEVRFASPKGQGKGKDSPGKGKAADRFSPYNSAADTKPVCRHFLQNKCTYGDNCTFSHAVGSSNGNASLGTRPTPMPMAAVAGSPSKSTLCRHFEQGRCNVPNCRFAHSVEELSEAAQYEMGVQMAPVQTGRVVKTSMCRHFEQGKCNVADCRFAHSPAELGAAPDNAGSRSGRFRTPESVAAAELQQLVRAQEAELEATRQAAAAAAHAAQVAEAQRKGKGGGKGGGKGTKAAICKHFQLGKCTYGDACSFSHDGPGPSPQPMTRVKVDGNGPVKKKSICRHFEQGKCTYGEGCSFAHSLEELA